MIHQSIENSFSFQMV